jgi:arylsulfatase A-like enzyme
MDLMPTVADLLGISSEVRFDGESLLSVLRGAKPATERLVFLEYPNATTPNTSHPDVYAVRGDGYKMVKALDEETGSVIGESCFDLSSDPHEQRKIPYDPRDEFHRAMALRLDGMIEEVRRYRLPFEITEYEMPLDQRADHIAARRDSRGRRVKELTPEQIESLRRLGYVE